MEPIHRAKSARNGFFVASVILFGFLTVQYVQRGHWDYDLGTAFFLSQVAYWGSLRYYHRRTRE